MQCADPNCRSCSASGASVCDPEGCADGYGLVQGGNGTCAPVSLLAWHRGGAACAHAGPLRARAAASLTGFLLLPGTQCTAPHCVRCPRQVDQCLVCVAGYGPGLGAEDYYDCKPVSSHGSPVGAACSSAGHPSARAAASRLCAPWRAVSTKLRPVQPGWVQQVLQRRVQYRLRDCRKQHLRAGEPASSMSGAAGACASRRCARAAASLTGLVCAPRTLSAPQIASFAT